MKLSASQSRLEPAQHSLAMLILLMPRACVNPALQDIESHDHCQN